MIAGVFMDSALLRKASLLLDCELESMPEREPPCS